MTSAPKVDLVISFDTTGSMYPALTQVRRRVSELVDRLFQEHSDIRIGITAHGDYCDAHHPYVTTHLHLSVSRQHIIDFVDTVKPTSGGDSPECYELVLHEARSFMWRKDATKLLVLIGDDVPHGPAQNPGRLNWRIGVQALADMGVTVYGIQALGRRHATSFYKELAELSGGFHLSLDQFSTLTDMLLAIGYQQVGIERMQSYAAEVQTSGRMTRDFARAVGTLAGIHIDPGSYVPATRDDDLYPAYERYTTSERLGRKKIPGSITAGTDIDVTKLRPVHPSRFQILNVDRISTIQDFVIEQGLTFHVGRGFYEFMKPEKVQAKKQIVIMDRVSGDMFTGSEARDMLGLPHDAEARLRPTDMEQFRIFIQSTSYNRKLIPDTGFLYEVADYEGFVLTDSPALLLT